jgi:hypothetical protein
MNHFVISGARVFDGDHMLAAVDVRVRGGTIVSIGTARPAGVELVEARGGILLPGRWVRPGGDRLEPGHRGVHRGLIVLVTVETRRRRRALRTLVPKPVVLQ